MVSLADWTVSPVSLGVGMSCDTDDLIGAWWLTPGLWL